MRTIDKCGGLDEYLLGEKAARIKDLGVEGWKLRWRIMQTDKVKERYRLQREAAGLPPKEELLVGAAGKKVSKKQIEEDVKKFDEQLQEDDIVLGDEIEGEFMHEQPAPAGKTVL